MKHLLTIGLFLAALTLSGCSSSSGSMFSTNGSLFSRSDTPTQTKETNIRGDMSPIGIVQMVRQ
jgi:hypothetical protein